ncbi:hypothetical protein HMPREF9124_0937 [Oribacterium sp. oral taxon 108 str. F0425]|nr:hypothetical protein HMPREF9124_0937 [Oribacterium sp. oral taxon 108 str. F0425]
MIFFRKAREIQGKNSHFIDSIRGERYNAVVKGSLSLFMS